MAQETRPTWTSLLAKTPKKYAESCLLIAVMQLSAKEEYANFTEQEILDVLLDISLSTEEMVKQENSKTQLWILKKDTDRYGDAGYSLPDKIICTGTGEQAKFLAEYISSYCPGCDDLFLVTS